MYTRLIHYIASTSLGWIIFVSFGHEIHCDYLFAHEPIYSFNRKIGSEKYRCRIA